MDNDNQELTLHNLKVSVVIATVGEGSLKTLIEQIKSSSCVPDEIIVVYPTVEMVKKIFIKFNDILVIRSPKSGQVAQRSLGISKAKNNCVLQLDADIQIKNNTIEKLVKAYNALGPKVAVGPKFKILNSKDPVKNKKKKLFKSIFKIFGGGNINIVDKNKPFRYDCWFFEYKQPKLSGYTNVLPGGCILFNKNYYKNFDFYPLEGKALGEDLLNSVYFQNYGCKLFYVSEASIYLSEEGIYSYKSVKHLIYDLKKIYEIKYLVCILAKGNVIRFHVWYYYYIIISIVKFFLKKLKVKSEKKITYYCYNTLL